jgi:hypothetical protein
VNAIDGDHIATVLVEQHEYLPMRRGQRARLAGNHYPVSAPINVASLVEIVRDSDLLAASLAQRHRSLRDRRLSADPNRLLLVKVENRIICNVTLARKPLHPQRLNVSARNASDSIGDWLTQPPTQMISGAILGRFVGSHRGAALMKGVGPRRTGQM